MADMPVKAPGELLYDRIDTPLSMMFEPTAIAFHVWRFDGWLGTLASCVGTWAGLQPFRVTQ